MTRFILISALGVLLALGNSARAEPSSTPASGAKRKRFTNNLNHVGAQNSAHPSPTATPKAASKTVHTFGPGEVGRSTTTSGRTGPPQNVPTSGGPRFFLPYISPNEYNEPDSPAAGPGFKSTGSPPGSFKTKSTSSAVTSTSTRKTASKVLIPSLSKNANATANEETSAAADIDANPPAPNELGAPIVIPMIPRYDAVPRSKALYLPDGNAPVPVDYAPPTTDAPVQISPTSLRAWNGEMTRETRTFDQTRVQLTNGADDARRWQFFWRASGAKPRAARWEISTVPFVDDGNSFPPAGLVAYGDASVAAPSPTTENFFAVEFNALAKHFGDEPMPNRFYLRVVPVDGSGHPAAQPSNWVRVDLP